MTGPKSERRQRPRMIACRMLPAEKALLAEAARRAGVSMSELAREAVMAEVAKELARDRALTPLVGRPAGPTHGGPGG